MSRLRRRGLRPASRKLALRPRVNLTTSVRQPGWTILNKLANMLRRKEMKTGDEKCKS